MTLLLHIIEKKIYFSTQIRCLLSRVLTCIRTCSQLLSRLILLFCGIFFKVLITLYWLGRKAQSNPYYNGPYLNLKAFENLLGQALTKVRKPHLDEMTTAPSTTTFSSSSTPPCIPFLPLLFFLHKKVLPLLYLAPWLLLFISHKSLLPSLLFFTLLDSHIDEILTIISAFAHISAKQTKDQ